MNDTKRNRAALVALLRPPISKKPALVRQDLAAGHSWFDQLNAAVGDSARVQEELVKAETAIAAWEADGTRFLTYLDPHYPAQLRDVFDYPSFVFARGKLLDEGMRDRGVCIVGSRSANAAVQGHAYDFAQALIRQGNWTIVSGLAKGIDTAAHRAALDLGARTVAVIGTGIRKAYPKENERLQRQMESEALVLSQFWPDDGGIARHFPMRNGVMSAYGSATIVIHAEESSGTRHQVTQAVKHGRPVILTRSVYTSTSWGKRFADDVNTAVLVADSPEHAIDILDRFTSAPETLQPGLQSVFQ